MRSPVTFPSPSNWKVFSLDCGRTPPDLRRRSGRQCVDVEEAPVVDLLGATPRRASTRAETLACPAARRADRSCAAGQRRRRSCGGRCRRRAPRRRRSVARAQRAGAVRISFTPRESATAAGARSLRGGGCRRAVRMPQQLRERRDARLASRASRSGSRPSQDDAERVRARSAASRRSSARKVRAVARCEPQLLPLENRAVVVAENRGSGSCRRARPSPGAIRCRRSARTARRAGSPGRRATERSPVWRCPCGSAPSPSRAPCHARGGALDPPPVLLIGPDFRVQPKIGGRRRIVAAAGCRGRPGDTATRSSR